MLRKSFDEHREEYDMFIPSNPERLHVISEIVQEELLRHEQAGGSYFDDKAELIAKHAIEACMPGLIPMQRSRVVVEASSGVSLIEGESASHNGIFVEAELSRISIQLLTAELPDPEFPMHISNYDLCAILTPRYTDPDPSDIVFGHELYVPFGDVVRFDAAQ